MTLSALGIFSAAGAGGAPAGAYELISTSIGTGSTDSITFNTSTLASTYRHLQLRITGQTLLGNTQVNVRFNGDTAGNYSYQVLYGNGLQVLNAGLANATFMFAGNTAFSSNTMVVGTVIDILDPFSTTKNKTIKSLYGSVGPNEVGFTTGNWRNTSAVSSITVYAAFGGANFTSASRFSLYGIRG